LILRGCGTAQQLAEKEAKRQKSSNEPKQGLKRLRKNTEWWAKEKKYIPQGLKPALILRRLRHD
jgi:hypothetical protein